MDKFISDITKGNPGAFSVVTEASKKDVAWVFALYAYCDKTGIRGSDLWVKYKEFGKDIDKFLKHVDEAI